MTKTPKRRKAPKVELTFEAVLLVGSDIYSRAEADDLEAVLVAAEKLWDECHLRLHGLVGWGPGRKKLEAIILVNGMRAMGFTKRPTRSDLRTLGGASLRALRFLHSQSPEKGDVNVLLEGL